MYANSASNPFIFGSLRKFSLARLFCCCRKHSGELYQLECIYELRVGSTTLHVGREMAVKGYNKASKLLERTNTNRLKCANV